MVPIVKHHKLPLLPFERELIQLAGITEDEYRFFVAESLKRAQVRPAEYDLIPDIRCDPATVSVLVSLAVGLVSTAVSYLLTPKPKAPDLGGRETGRRDLASRTGQDVFAPTTGFDSLAALANYDEPIPVIFGRYTGTTGGILVSPKLVWSRALSYGLEQGVKLMFIVGEQGVGTAGIERPDLAGIFLGNTPLDAAFDHKFSFYWRSGTFNNTSRINAVNLRYGTLESGISGDIFTAPTNASATDTAFCMSYTPSSNSQFGVFSPVYNGTDYRVNWKLVPIPVFSDGDNDPRNQLTTERVKIAGNYGITNSKNAIIAKAQSGIGRGYSRRMGITAINGIGTSNPDAIEERSISVGNTCTFTISGTTIPIDFYYAFLGPRYEGVQVGDINSELNSQRAAADSVLQVGETIQIASSIWLVTGRSQSIWQPGITQTITMRCIEVLGSTYLSQRIGVVGRNLLEKHVLTEGPNEGTTSIVPISFYPLMRTQIATVRNTRPCDSTELGIRSQVWNRANGLCNFNALPSPLEFINNENNNVAINSSTMTLYMDRTSAFSIQVRPAGVDSLGRLYGWVDLGILFCVTGNQPVDLYNFIRLQHPERRQYEFRFFARPGADVIGAFNPMDVIWQLDGKRPQIGEQRLIPGYGTFTVFAAAQKRNRNELQFNPEMGSAAGSEVSTAPTTADRATNVYVVAIEPSVGYDQGALQQAFFVEALGTPFGGNVLGVRYFQERTYTISTGKQLTLRWSGTPANNPDTTRFPGIGRLWLNVEFNIVAGTVTGKWTLNEQFGLLTTLSTTNAWIPLLPGIRVTSSSDGVLFGFRMQVGAIETINTPGLPDPSVERIFERNSQLADVSFYSSLLQKSNESQPEHTISYVNEIIRNDAGAPNYTNMVTAGLALKASRTYNSIDQIRMWKDDGIPVQRFHPAEAGTIGPSNLFCDLVYYLLTDRVAGAGATISPTQIKTSDFAVAAQFLRTNGLFFDGAITDPVNIRQYITQLAPFFLCNFVIADGLFSLVPALPTTSGGAISSNAVPISALFTDGNILEGTFGIEYINSEERNNIQAVLRYREGVKNQLPEERTITVRWNETGATDHKIESFDLTAYCTSRAHALLVGKYLLSVRRRITHTVKFKTTPEGLNLAPGRYIRVITQVSPYSGANNGVISETGAITAATPLANGSYSIIFYKPPATDVATTTLTASNGTTSQSNLYGSVFTVTNASTQSNVYVVEQLSFDEDGMVEIAASEFPTDSSLRSVIAQDMLSTTAFVTEN